MKNFFLSKKFYIPAGLLVVLIIALSFRQDKEGYSFVTVERKDVVQEISVTGKIKPAQSVSLSFEQGGKIASVYVDVGDRVGAYQSLVRIDTTSTGLSLAQEEARLNELLRGTRLEDIAILESRFNATQTGVTQKKQAVRDALSKAYTVSDDAIHNYADQFFDNPRTSNPSVNIPITDSQLKIDLNNARVLFGEMFLLWQNDLATISGQTDLSAYIVRARKNLEMSRDLLDKLSIAVNTLAPNQALTATMISTYRSNVSTARSAVTGALTGLTSDETALSSAFAELDFAQKNLDLARAGALPEQIEAQQAKVNSLKHTISVSILRSPIRGTVTRQDAKIGEVAGPNQAIVSVISEDDLEIEAFVPEVDIGAMKIGNTATITFDAFPEVLFEGKIMYVDPAETIIDGVPTYKVKLFLSLEDSRIRSGMTANLSVKVAERPQALTLPYRAIFGSSGDRHVFIQLTDGTVQETPVEIGIRGVGGEVEIVFGVDEGAIIAIPDRF